MLLIGRFIHQHAYARERHEIAVGSVKIDLIWGPKKQVLIGEIKKSSRAEKSAVLQLKYYLYVLREMGLELEGVLLVPEERKKMPVALDETGIEEVRKAIEGVKRIVAEEKAPPPARSKWCQPCAYAEFCWA